MTVSRLRPDFLTRCVIDPTKAEAIATENQDKYNTPIAGNFPCTGDAAEIKEGRKSFPSGHSAISAFSAFLAVSFCIARSKDFQKRLDNHTLRNKPRTSDRNLVAMTVEEGHATANSTDSTTLQTFQHSSPAVPAVDPTYNRFIYIFSNAIIRIGCGVLGIIPVFFSLWIAGSRISDNRHHPSDVLVGYSIGAISGLTSLAILSLEDKTPENTSADNSSKQSPKSQ